VGEQNRYGYATWSSFHADGKNEVLRLKVQDLIWKAPWAGEVARRFGEEYETPRRTIEWAFELLARVYVRIDTRRCLWISGQRPMLPCLSKLRTVVFESCILISGCVCPRRPIDQRFKWPCSPATHGDVPHGKALCRLLSRSWACQGVNLREAPPLAIVMYY
jgi:hypothetical protein